MRRFRPADVFLSLFRTNRSALPPDRTPKARLAPLRGVERLEAREVPAASVLAVGADAGGGPRVTLLDRGTGAVVQDFFAYDQAFTGGVRVGIGDFNNDGSADVVTAPGSGGGPLIRVFDGKTAGLIREFNAFDPAFTGGVNLGVGDVTGDGKDDIVAAVGSNGVPLVRVFDGTTGQLFSENFAYDAAFLGGVNVAVGDVNGDKRADIVVGTNAGGVPLVRALDGTTGAALSEFLAFDAAFLGGVNVASADLTADGKAEIVVAAGAGGLPIVRVINALTAQAISEFFAYDQAFTGGVRVGAYSLDLLGRPGVVTSPGVGGFPEIRIFSAPGGVAASLFSAFNSGFTGGSFVAGSGLPAQITQMSGGSLGNFIPPGTPNGPTLVSLQLDPLNINLLGLEIRTSPITINISVEPGDGQLLGNLLTVVSNLVNLQGVNNALNNVLDTAVGLLNGASLSVPVDNTTGPLSSSSTATTTPVLDLFVAPVYINLLGARVDTSSITLSIRARSGQGLLLGNALTSLANLFNPPLPGTLNLDDVNNRLAGLINDLNAQLPGFPPAQSTPRTLPAGTRQVVSLVVPPIDVNLLGLILQTSRIQVNADAQTGNGELLGNVLSTLLNTLGATPENLETLSNNLNAVLAKVVGVLNTATLALSAGATQSLAQVFQTLSLPGLVNTTGQPATARILDLAIATPNPDQVPPVDLDLLGLKVTTSNVQAQLLARTGEGQVLGNLVYNVAHLLDVGGSLNLLTILNQLGI